MDMGICVRVSWTRADNISEDVPDSRGKISGTAAGRSGVGGGTGGATCGYGRGNVAR